MDAIRRAAQSFAKVVVKNTEDGPEATLAQRHIEQSVFYGIRSILFNPAEDDGPAKPKPVVKKTTKRVAKRG